MTNKLDAAIAEVKALREWDEAQLEEKEALIPPYPKTERIEDLLLAAAIVQWLGNLPFNDIGRTKLEGVRQGLMRMVIELEAISSEED